MIDWLIDSHLIRSSVKEIMTWMCEPCFFNNASSCNIVKCRFYSQIQNIIVSRSKSVTCRLSPPTTTTNQNRECDARKASASCRPRHLHSRTFDLNNTQHWTFQQHTSLPPSYRTVRSSMKNLLQSNNIIITGGWVAIQSRKISEFNWKNWLLFGSNFFNLMANVEQHQYNILVHAIPYHNIPYHTIPYHTIPYHTTPS